MFALISVKDAHGSICAVASIAIETNKSCSKSAANYRNSVWLCRHVYWFSGASCCSQVGRGSGLRRKMPGVCCSVTNLCKHLTSKPFSRTVWAATARLWWPLTTLIKTLSLASDNYHNKHRSLGEILHHFLPFPTRLNSYCNYYNVFFISAR